MSVHGHTGAEVRRRVKSPSSFRCKIYSLKQSKEILEGVGETTGLTGGQPLENPKEQSGISQQLGNAAEGSNAEISEDGSTTREQTNPLQDLLRNKHKVRIQPYIISFRTQIRASTSSNVVVVENFGESPVVLLKARIGHVQDVAHFDFDFGRESKSPQELLVELKPNSSWEFEIKCTTRQFGRTKELLILDFGSFLIGRWLCVHSIAPEQNTISCRPNVLVKNWKKTKQQSMNNILNEKKMNIVAALRLDNYPLGNFNNIRKFKIPSKILQCFTTQDQSQLLESYPSLLNDLDASNYVEQFAVALWFEEIEKTIQRRQFDLKDVILKPDAEGCCIIPVNKFSEFHPPIVVGDLVGIYKTSNSSDMYKGPIQTISLNDKGIQCVHVRLPQEFNNIHDGGPWTIWFDFGRNSYRRTHFAVREAIKQLGPEWLFPTSLTLTEPRIDYMEDLNDNLNPRRTENADKENSACMADLAEQRIKSKMPCPGNTSCLLPIKWFNEKLNSEQKNAVKNILKGQAQPLPYIIFGPPGTGKTVTIVEAIMQFYFLEPTSRILVTAPSNVASDLITEQLVATNRFSPGDLVHFNGFTRRSPIPNTIAKFCEGIECLDIAVNSRLIICTVVTAGQLFQLGLSTGHFNHLFIDEAGYCTEPEAMIPCVLAAVDKQTQVILAGDPQQLGPVLLCNAKFSKILQRSFLERFMGIQLYARNEQKFPETKHNPKLITKLLRSYRAHPVLLQIPSQLFYNKELVSDGIKEDHELCENLTFLPKKGIPLLFHGVDGNCNPRTDSPGWFNLEEAYQVIEYVKLLKENGVASKDIGIITPYRKQVEVIQEGIKTSLPTYPLPKIASIEELQGGERKVVIISTVRSYSEDVVETKSSCLDFLFSKRRFNVAITRAKALLIIVGNPFVLFKSLYWRSLLDFSMDLGVYTGCQLPDFRGPKWHELRRSIARTHIPEIVKGTEEASVWDDDKECYGQSTDIFSRF